MNSIIRGVTWTCAIGGGFLIAVYGFMQLFALIDRLTAAGNAL